MGYTGQRPSAIPLTSADIVDGTITNDDLAGSITSAKITSLDATKLTGSIADARVPASAVTQHVTATDLSQLEMNQALLAFKVASANQLAKFSMVDQVIDEYQDATGIDAGNSTNELAGGATTAKYYEGGTSTIPTITENSDSDGTDGDYTWYKWTSGSSGSFQSSTAQNVEVMVVAGGGAGGNAGGGAGGYRTNTAYSVSANTAITSITVGAGGAVTTVADTSPGGSGGNSIFGTITSAGGGGGGGYDGTRDGVAGGSGGGANPASGTTNGTVGAGNTPSTSPVQGYAGGLGRSDGATYTAGGSGGGAGGAAADVALPSPNNADNVVHTPGGVGIANDITGTSLFYAGGGGGGFDTANIGGAGGSSVGGNGSGYNGVTNASVPTANRGGGGGGKAARAGRTAGAAGVVVVRVLTDTVTSGANLTLQSVATTAESAPTKADLVVLIEDGSGTATVNTDVKGYISRNGSAFSTAVTFVDEGDWGTNKRILVAREVDISGITSGTSMKYKLTTHNQSAGSKETRIHATSLAWS